MKKWTVLWFGLLSLIYQTYTYAADQGVVIQPPPEEVDTGPDPFMDKRDVTGIHIGFSHEFLSDNTILIPSTHTYLQLGYLKRGSILVLGSVALVSTRPAIDDIGFTGGRLGLGYAFDFGLYGAFAYGLLPRSEELTESVQLGYIAESGITFSLSFSAYQYLETISSIHIGFGVGYSI